MKVVIDQPNAYVSPFGNLACGDPIRIALFRKQAVFRESGEQNLAHSAVRRIIGVGDDIAFAF